MLRTDGSSHDSVPITMSGVVTEIRLARSSDLFRTLRQFTIRNVMLLTDADNVAETVCNCYLLQSMTVWESRSYMYEFRPIESLLNRSLNGRFFVLAKSSSFLRSIRTLGEKSSLRLKPLSQS